jgi:hypothetical protein
MPSEGIDMIQSTTISKSPLVSRADHRHELAAAAATAGILAGIDAGHRIPTGDLVGSPGSRRSLVPSKPAIPVGNAMANTSPCNDVQLSPGRYPVRFVGVEHQAVFKLADGTDRIVRLPVAESDYAEEMAPVLEDVLNSGNARDLLESLTMFFDDSDGYPVSSDRGPDLVKKAAALLDAIEDLRQKFKAE